MGVMYINCWGLCGVVGNTVSPISEVSGSYLGPYVRNLVAV